MIKILVENPYFEECIDIYPFMACRECNSYCKLGETIPFELLEKIGYRGRVKIHKVGEKIKEERTDGLVTSER
jgi:hypothetical protein